MLENTIIALALSIFSVDSSGYIDKNKDNKTNFSTCYKAAEHGDADAQNSLGVMYADGEGVSQDYKQALSWLSKAAEHGYPTP